MSKKECNDKIIIVTENDNYSGGVKVIEGIINYTSKEKVYKSLADEMLEGGKMGIKYKIYLPDDFEM
jgi:hypothetical protein